jgi:hypothetical protein
VSSRRILWSLGAAGLLVSLAGGAAALTARALGEAILQSMVAFVGAIVLLGGG